MRNSQKITGPLCLVLGAAALCGPVAPVVAKTNPKSSDAAGPVYRLPEVVARVDGSTISRDQVDSELERNFGQQIVFTLVVAHLVEERAAKLGLTPTAAEIDRAFQEANMNAQGGLLMMLKQHNMARPDFEKMVLRPKLEMQKLSKYGISVSDADIQTYFNEHKSEWAGPEQVELLRIHTPTLDAANRASAELAAGKPWAEVLQKFSDDKDYYKANGGLYGTIVRSVLPPEIATAISGLKAGEVSKPMEIAEEGPAHGYVIWKLNKIVSGAEAKLADHKEEIKQKLITARTKPDMELITDLIKNAKISNLPPGYADVFTRFTTAPLAPPRRVTPPGIGGPGNAPPPPPPMN